LPSYNPVTERVYYITTMLKKMGVEYNLDYFSSSKYSFGKYVNVEVVLRGNSSDTIMYIAHHDINNPNSDNCQDNSASVSILIDLANKLKNKNLNKNVVIVWTDCEEFGGRGASRLADNIKNGKYGNVEYVVNLELTANGTEFWGDVDDTPLVDKLEIAICNEMNKDFFIIDTPFNDSVVLRGRGIDSVCIGTLNEGDMNIAYDRGYCNTWRLCHKKHDRFENARGEDMQKVVELLMKLI